MYYCDVCATGRNWPTSINKSTGTCELCGEVALCNDQPFGVLPLPVNEGLLMEAAKVLGQLQAMGFTTAVDKRDMTILEKGDMRITLQVRNLDKASGETG